MAWDEKDFWMVLYGRKKCQEWPICRLGCLIVEMGATIPQSSSVAYQFGISVPLLVGNIMSISISEAISVLGSLLKPEDFNFSVMKQKIAVV